MNLNILRRMAKINKISSSNGCDKCMVKINKISSSNACDKQY